MKQGSDMFDVYQQGHENIYSVITPSPWSGAK